MNYRFRFHPLVQEDYNEAYTWYEEKQKGLGERFLKAVSLKVDAITENPELYGSKGNKKFREAKVEFFPYLIVFKINKRTKEVYVSTVHHTKKRPGKKYRR